MELELKTEDLSVFEKGGEVTLTQEETTETIVPDYCPDIARIIKTDGRIDLHSREIRDGKAEIAGTVRVTVLYTPDGESGIRTLEFAIPFAVESEGHALPDCTQLTVETETALLETRMLNPRKVFTHCKLVTRMTGYKRAMLDLCTDVEADESLRIQKRMEPQNAVLLTHIAEKDFTFTEVMNLSPGRDGAAELLTHRVKSAITEQKIVGNKLMFKGVFTVELLYRTADGRCCSSTGELPFSQIMEVEGAAEDADAAVQLDLTGTDLQIDGGDEGREIAVTLYLHAMAFLREERTLVLLNDLYSTVYDVRYDAEPLPLTSFCQRFSQRQTVREVLEIGVVAEATLSVSVHCGTVNVSREGERSVLRTVATVQALYLDEGGVPLVAERGMDVSCQLELPPDCQVTARADCMEEVQVSLGDRGIEVRFPVDFQIEASTMVKRVGITGVQVDPETPRETISAPSLVLRRLGKEECAWDLAKRYNTTIDSILSANQIESEEDLPQEQLLLIPRKRA